MPPITTLPVDPALPPAAGWDAVARAASGWCAAHGLAVRDVVLLLPFAALLPPARAAFARRGGWPPRIETVQTLAEALAPPSSDGPGSDPAADRLAASALLGQQGFGVEWRARDPAGFRLAAETLAATVGTLVTACAATAPAGREAFWQTARRAAALRDGPGAIEQALLRLAVEWAASAPLAQAPGLFGHRPAAWIVVQAGGPDRAAEALLQAGNGPGLRIVTDSDPQDPFGAAAGRPALVVCEHFEAEAQAAAAEVLRALHAGRTPVALVALDRELVRRIRALLERQGVALLDETGWRLSTTRAAARVMAWLRAADPAATADDRLAWLKDWPPARARPGDLRRLEARWRREGAAGDPLWAAGQEALAPLADLGDLADGTQRLALALRRAGEWDALAADAAGAAALQALRLDGGPPGWLDLAQATALDRAGYAAWADAELEAASVTLQAADADVVLTPLSRALARPFGAVVVPGADAVHLGRVAPVPGLIGDVLAEALGLETVTRQRERERLAVAQLLRVPELVLLRRRLEGDEPLAASPLLQWLEAARARRGQPPLERRAPALVMQDLVARPVARPLPTAADALPASLSASQVEQLRRCPYQFFARTVLRLSEPDELERELEKRDYGSWLHAVLHRFHRDGGGDAAALHAAAEAELQALGHEPAAMLPYRASFEAFAPAYLGWWARRQAAGWRWLDGESELRVQPGALAPTGLHGRLDRLDEQGARWFVLDYKTGGPDKLKRSVKEPLEDTQLAFYAALLDGRAPGDVQAAYLTLDEPEAPQLIVHPEVQASAAALLHGLGGELQRLRAGAALPALGEGAACEFCAVRGLCRRDQWGVS